jgi:hypothetical protein
MSSRERCHGIVRLNVGRETVEIVLEIREELLLTAAGLEITECKLGGL